MVLEERVAELEEKQAALEKKFEDGLLLLGACDIDTVVRIIEKRINLNRLEKQNSSQ